MTSSEHTTTGQTASNSWCSRESVDRGMDIIGFASKDFLVAVEIAAPWPRNILAAKDCPVALVTMTREWAKSGRRFAAYGVVPPVELQKPGWRWVLLVRRHDFGFVRHAFHVPQDRVDSFLGQVMREPDRCSELYDWSVQLEPVDVLLCTHEDRDRCCGKFGRELLNDISERAIQGVNFWQCSHIGGHMYAPTAITLPDLRCWGYLDVDTLSAILARRSFAEVVRCYRGWGFLDSVPEQIAERDLLIRYGWDWLEQISAHLPLSCEKKKDGSFVIVALAENSQHHRWEIALAGSIKSRSSCREDSESDHRQYCIVRYSS